jgi:Integrase core domain
MMQVLMALWVANRKVYGAHKLWKAASRVGHDIGRDQVRFTERLDGIGARPSIGTVADSFDNALAETTNGLYEAECVYGPDANGWEDVDELELATLSWAHWFNHERLHGHCDHVPPRSSKQRSTLPNRPTPPGLEFNTPSLHQTQGGSVVWEGLDAGELDALVASNQARHFETTFTPEMSHVPFGPASSVDTNAEGQICTMGQAVRPRALHEPLGSRRCASDDGCPPQRRVSVFVAPHDAAAAIAAVRSPTVEPHQPSDPECGHEPRAL